MTKTASVWPVVLLALLLAKLPFVSRGQIAPQGGEFYAITGALFVTLAFPGFTYRYLFKHRT